MDDLRELFEGFSIHLQAAGHRPSTVDWYAKHARRFCGWLRRAVGLSAITPSSIKKPKSRLVARTMPAIVASDKPPAFWRLLG